ncbi:MAG: molybdate ABC transporter substrate-binding protein [Spirochaetes bacterium]|jgi:molybdate transport system substrate-binding protein|nr:molybdate ABC transporter substrate-binding protein [Spirochaetota bacterium]
MKKLVTLLYILVIFFSVFTASCSKRGNYSDTENSVITVYAAAGARVVTDEVIALFTKQSGIKVDVNYTSSGTLARQIESGAPCDIYISANSKWMEFLKEKKILNNTTITKIAGNSLALIMPVNRNTPVPQFNYDYNITVFTGTIAIGDPSYVPVGSYTKRAFDKLGWTDMLEGRLILAKDVTSVLRYVELGECDFGIVYYTEAIQSDKVQIATEISDDYYPEISFYTAMLNGADENSLGFFNLLTGKEGLALFKKHGFKEVKGN